MVVGCRRGVRGPVRVGPRRGLGRGSAGRTWADPAVDEWWLEAAMRGRASCTPLQRGKAWGNG